jgi:DNA methyltransferase 1-associated protein 1
MDDDPLASGELILNLLNVPCSCQVAYFGKFDQHGPSVMEYSQYEYDQHLVDKTGNWSSHETAYLFDILREYDLRFIVVADRYEYMGFKGEGPRKTRDVDVCID